MPNVRNGRSVSIGEYIKRAAKWEPPAIAVTDHNWVQIFPDAMRATKAYKKHRLKVINICLNFPIMSGR